MYKRFFTLTTLLIMIICAPFKVSAYEMFWNDRNVSFEKFTKVVVFPFSNAWDEAGVYYVGGYGLRDFDFNAHLDDMLAKKFKKVSFVNLSDEKNLNSLLQPFEDEKSRAAAVKELTNADAYIVPRFRERRVQSDISPRKEFDVELKTWTEIKGSQNSDGTYNERTRTVHHVVDERYVHLNIMEIEITAYNTKGEEIFTYFNEDRNYGITEEKQFKDLTKDFRKIIGESKKSKSDKKIKPNDIAVGFEPVVISSGKFKDDIHMLKGADYSLQKETKRRIKKVKLITSSNVQPQYKIKSEISRFELDSKWMEPSYFVTNKVVRTDERKWYDKDKDGNQQEHTETTTYYDQEISNFYAHWSFYWDIDSIFEFVDSKGKVILSKKYKKWNDKPADSYRHAVEDFCKEINKYFKSKK